MTGSLPQHARVVIIGGGAVGCAVAYHLAHRGETDVLLTERDQLTSGTTWHAAGLVGQLRASHNMSRLAMYSRDLYARLEAETGQATGFLARGSIMVAGSDGRWDELRRAHSTAKSFGLETHLITPDEVAERWPLIDTAGIRGGLWLPGDGQINPADVTRALAKGARRLGITVRERTPVTAIERDGRRAAAVTTAEGRVAADAVVVCAGMWSRELVAPLGVRLPLHPAEHFYVLTEAIPELPTAPPVLRDPDNALYFKEDAGKLMVGMFEPVAKPWGTDGVPHASFQQLPEDWDHLAPELEAAMARVPAVGRAGIRLFFNGPESFTPDDRYLLGALPEVPGAFVACGFNSVGVQSAAGAGRVLADWVVDGHAPMDLSDVDVRRMLPFQGGRHYLRDRTVETPGLLYAMHWPHRQYATARGARRSPVHDRVAAFGAAFGEAGGWERPDFFGEPGTTPAYDYSFGRPAWWSWHAAEHRAAREDLALFDQSGFAQFLVQGPDAPAALEAICSNRVDVDPGRVVYTLLLNERGRIESDVTVTRLDGERFVVVAPATAQRRDYWWLRHHLPGDARATITDVTSAEAVFGVMGPRSRTFLEALARADLSDAVCPFGHWIELAIGYALVRAARVTYVGELGWELYVPAEQATTVLDAIMAATEPPRPAGFHALHSLRVESGYRHWGHDITDEDDPVAAGLGFACARDKSYIGRDAVGRLRERPPPRRLVSLCLDDPEPLIYHDEPIRLGDRIVGRITSGRYGHTLGAAVGLGWVEHPDRGPVDRAFLGQDGFSVEVAAARVPARLSPGPLFDPRRERVRGPVG